MKELKNMLKKVFPHKTLLNQGLGLSKERIYLWYRAKKY
jgi:hypothetical protein